MSRILHPRIRMTVLLATGSLGLAWWAFQPDAPAPVARTDRPSLEKRLTRQRQPLPRPDRPASIGSAPQAAAAPEHSPERPAFSAEWEAQRAEVFEALFRRVVPPSPSATRAVAGDYRRRSRERRAYLAVLELELVDLIENEPDPYTRWDAEIALAEVYLAQAEVFDTTWIPDSFSDERADRRLSALQRRAAIARDKADLVVHLATGEAATLPDIAADDPVRLRMDALYLRLGRGG